ncbi:MAG: autotransporter outer membrane beta-barrel domain-containing protein [Pseudomonadota bacterium]
MPPAARRWRHHRLHRRRRHGSAALGGAASERDDGFSTLGAQIFGNAMEFAGGALTPSVRAGWQHAFSNRLASRNLSLLSTGQRFTVLGTRLDADRALLDLDLTLALGGRTSVSLGYAGTYAARGTDQAVRLMGKIKL